MSTQDVIKEALNLSPNERTRLIEALLVSFDAPDREVEAAWNQEIERRIDGILSGKTATVYYKDVFPGS